MEINVHSDELDKIIKFTGGKENISTVSHCLTRLRFVLNDPELADIESIKQIPGLRDVLIMQVSFRSLSV